MRYEHVITERVEEHEEQKTSFQPRPQPRFALFESPEPAQKQSVTGIMFPRRDKPRTSPSGTSVGLDSCPILSYLLARRARANLVILELKQKAARVADKRLRLDTRIAQQTQDPKETLGKWKDDIMKTPTYRDMVRYYLFASTRLGWQIPLPLEECVQFPFARFVVAEGAADVRFHMDETRARFTRKRSVLASDCAYGVRNIASVCRILDLRLAPNIRLWNQRILSQTELGLYLTSAMDGIAAEVEREFRLRNALSTGNLGGILLQIAYRVREFALYLDKVDRLCREFIVSDFTISIRYFHEAV